MDSPEYSYFTEYPVRIVVIPSSGLGKPAVEVLYPDHGFTMACATRWFRWSALLICLIVATSIRAEMPSPSISQELQPLLRHVSRPGVDRSATTSLTNPESALTSFYENRHFAPAWLTDASHKSQVTALLACIEAADSEGLDPDLYHLDRLQTLVAEYDHNVATSQPIDAHLVATLDILLTEAFFRLGSHLASGRVDPLTICAEWMLKTRAPLLTRLLEKALAEGRVAEVLSCLRPSHTGYLDLRQAYLDHRRIVAAGDWPPIPDGPTLIPGDQDPRIVILRNRLALSGDLNRIHVSDDDHYDRQLEEAVRLFQGRHGLREDGLVGAKTLSALNVTAEARAAQIALNLERWRWMPRLFRPRHIMVNIADFSLSCVDGANITSSMRVVVGTKERPTPIISGELTYLELNPFWNIPQKLAQDDILPLIGSDPEYLVKQRIRVFSNWSLAAAELAADTIDWINLTPANFAYRLRQDPGPANALGRIKFIFHNAHSVYLHDTPARHLFQLPQRTFSSGCVRVEKPIQLAEELLKDDPGWTREMLLAAIAAEQTKTIELPRPIPIYLLYWTAWVCAEGRVQFRADIYDYDVALQEALNCLEASPLPDLPRELLTLR